MEKWRRLAAPPSLGRKRPRKQTARPRAVLLRCTTYAGYRSSTSEIPHRSITKAGQECYSLVASGSLRNRKFRSEGTSAPRHQGGVFRFGSRKAALAPSQQQRRPDHYGSFPDLLRRAGGLRRGLCWPRLECRKGDGNLRQVTSERPPDLFHAASFVGFRYVMIMICRHELAPLVKGSGAPA
jgi:hypothetical protein